MPKKQTSAARPARRIQAVTGLSYTTCLTLCDAGEETWTALADELRSTGPAEAADGLLKAAAAHAEAHAWVEAAAVTENAFHDTDRPKVEQVRQACLGAAAAALKRAGYKVSTYEMEAEVYHCAFLALARAGSIPDGRTLARAAVDVLDGDPLECSDVVRAQGRAPFTYATAADLTGPETPYAVAAPKAARAIAAASAVQRHGDEEWHEAAGHMVEAVWHGCAAADLPPLHERRGHQDFFDSGMDAALPTE